MSFVILQRDNDVICYLSARQWRHLLSFSAMRSVHMNMFWNVNIFWSSKCGHGRCALKALPSSSRISSFNWKMLILMVVHLLQWGKTHHFDRCPAIIDPFVLCSRPSQLFQVTTGTYQTYRKTCENRNEQILSVPSTSTTEHVSNSILTYS